MGADRQDWGDANGHHTDGFACIALRRARAVGKPRRSLERARRATRGAREALRHGPGGAPEPQDNGRFGERSAIAGDIDGDGVNDIFVSAFQQDVGTATKAGKVYLLSGRDRHVIYALNSPDPQANERFGFFISVPGDLDGDGKNDIVVAADLRDVFRNESKPGEPDPGRCGTPEPNGCNENEGAAFAYSGATGKLLYPLVNPAPQSNDDSPFGQTFGFGVGLGSAGDINGDGRSEILVGAASNDVPRDCNKTGVTPCRVDQGQVFVFDGRTGGLIRTYDLPDPEPASCNSDKGNPGATSCGFLGFAVQGVGDVDGDGVTDHLLDAGTYNGRHGRMYLFSGRLGTLIRTIDSPNPDTRIFGLQDVAPGTPGDVNGDNVNDIYGNSFNEVGPGGNGEGRGFVFDGKSGNLLYTLRDPTPVPGGAFGYSVARTDYNKDGKDDLFVGQNGSEPILGGGSDIFNGPDGSFLKGLDLPVEDRFQQRPLPPPGARFGRTVAAPGDLNQDGLPDYVVAPHRWTWARIRTRDGSTSSCPGRARPGRRPGSPAGCPAMGSTSPARRVTTGSSVPPARTRSTVARATTWCSPASVTTPSAAEPATTRSEGVRVTTTSTARPATTASKAASVTTRSPGAPATTRCSATPATTSCRATPATTASRVATATTAWRRAPASIGCPGTAATTAAASGSAGGSHAGHRSSHRPAQSTGGEG